MKVYITGISGFLSINLVRYLLDHGIDQIAGIDLVDFDYPERDKIEFLQGDIRNKEDLKKSMQGADVVVHTAAALPLYSPEDIYSTDIIGTRNVLEQAKEYGVKRFIHISSTAVYGVPDHHPLYETDSVDGVGPYGEAKVQAEEICKEFRDDGMCVTIIRPSPSSDRNAWCVRRCSTIGPPLGNGFPMIGSGNNLYQLLDVEDLCQALLSCMKLDEKKVNDTFNIGAAEYGTMKDDYQVVLDKAGYGKKIVGFPAGLVIAGLKILEKLNLSPLYPWVYETASKESFVSIEKAQKVLNFKPRYSNKDALLRNYDWYLANKDSFSGQAGVTHRVPWKQKALKVAKIFF